MPEPSPYSVNQSVDVRPYGASSEDRALMADADRRRSRALRLADNAADFSVIPGDLNPGYAYGSPGYGKMLASTSGYRNQINDPSLAPNGMLSEQAITTSLSRMIEDSPRTAQRLLAQEEDEALMAQAAEAKSAEAIDAQIQMEADKRTAAAVGEVLDSLGIRPSQLRQMQQANRDVPVSPMGTAAFRPLPKGTSAIDTTGFQGSYTQTPATYAEPKKKGNIGTIDLRADTPVRQPVDSEAFYDDLAMQFAKAGRMEDAKRAADIASMRREFVRGKSDEELKKAQVKLAEANTAKAMAEAEEIVAKLNDPDAGSIDPNRTLIAGNQAIERKTAFQKAYIAISMENKGRVVPPEEMEDYLFQLYTDAEALWNRLPTSEIDNALIEHQSKVLSKGGVTKDGGKKSPPPDLMRGGLPRAK